MGNVRVVFNEVQVVATALRQAANDTVPKLTQVQNAVNDLLQQNGGLWMLTASPALNDSYKEFSANATTAVNSIPSWANQFENIASTLKDMDRQITENTKAK